MLNINEVNIMNSSYDLYYIFYVVAKEGSISAASKALFKSQPAFVAQSVAR